jgi:hypothetical protein
VIPTNAVVSISRMVYDATTKQNTPTVVATLVPVSLIPVESLLRPELIAGEAAAAFNYRFFCAAWVDVRDGDTLQGYNPTSLAVAPILQVQHVAVHSPATNLFAYRSAMVKVMQP